MPRLNLTALPAGAAVLDSIAAAWLANAGGTTLEAADGLILLPTRRAARSLAEAFLRQSHGHALLLPRIVALGALDEAPLALSGALELRPAVAEPERLAVLARLVMAAESAPGRAMPAERAWALARELAALQDEAERAEIDLEAALPNAVPAVYAAHWQVTLAFLAIVTKTWPAWLAEHGLMNPTARRIALLDAEARVFGEHPPPFPVWAVASGGESPAEARLWKAVGALPRGRVILPALDREMADDLFTALAIDHPEHADAGIARLLGYLGATRGDVEDFPALSVRVPRGRAAMLRRALLPAEALDAWREDKGDVPTRLDGLTRLVAADQQQEAMAIAMLLRDALETPGARAALITPDRELAQRVSQALLRFGIVADDSAGEALAATPPAIFLRLLVEATDANFAPLALLSLMKHPLFAAGLPTAEARRRARGLERAMLRGPGPAPGLARLVLAAKHAASMEEQDLVARLSHAVAPLEQARAVRRAPPDALLRALVESAEALAATEVEAGAVRLWALEEGEALALQVAELITAMANLPPIPPTELAGLLAASLVGKVVRSRRALRGRGGTEHPRVFIWGLLEARLQSVEVAVLGGLIEGTWPPATDPGPWLSRPMRVTLGLPPAEEAVGRAAQDFLSASLAAPDVVLAHPRRRDGAPTVPARWLVRLAAMLGRDALPRHPAARWAALLDQPARAKPARPPQPRPPLALRPRRLSVSEIADWLTNPYVIYARHVLDLEPLPEIAEALDARDFGMVVHRALARFFKGRQSWPDDAAARLDEALAQALAEAGLPPDLVAWWRPRLPRIALSLAKIEAARHLAGAPLLLRTEQAGEWRLGANGREFLLAARADRIERRPDGTLAIWDYKTGSVPSATEVESGHAPQLPLEGAMAEAGAFGLELTGRLSELAYMQLSGRSERDKLTEVGAGKTAEMVRCAVQGLASLIAEFDDPNRAYLARPFPTRSSSAADYDQLARLAEWAEDE